jgi:arginyl-tRNA synthetase
MPTPLADLRSELDAAVAALAEGSAPGARLSLERPKVAEHGDYATNAAMLLAPVLKAPPRDIAARLGEALGERLGGALQRSEVAGPGFLNLVLGDPWYRDALASVVAAGEAWGGGQASPARRVNVEYVSVNPTGPIHVGHMRGAAIGDSLARLLAFHGHDVHREFYINDFGSQIARFAESLQARARDEEPGEDGYRGAYVAEIAAEIPDCATRPLDEVAAEGVRRMLAQMRASLARFRVEFDTWASERALHEAGKVQHAFDVLEAQGRTYRSEGALWLRTTEFGDDKDRVLVRSSGEHTYFASDIAYHLDKRERGFEWLVDVWGADHHGYVKRMKAMFEALGGDPDDLDLLIMQLVDLVGQRFSKRAGVIVTLDELVDDIGVDAARFFLVQRSFDTPMTVDLELARREAPENPVYYVQYAHARIASIRREAAAEAVGEDPAELHPSERALVKRLLEWPDAVAEAAERRAPHRVATYVLDLAQDFSAFYRDCKVRGHGPFRRDACAATQAVLARGLDLLGVTAPESM